MKKILVIILSMLMLVSCFGCTAMNEAGGPDVTIPTIYDGEEKDSKEETPTGWSTVIEGRYLKAKTGHLIIYDGGPVELRTEDSSIFEDLTDGDLITIGCNFIEESYPGGTTVLYLEKIADGEYEDLDKNTLAMLSELGWIDYVITEDEPMELTGYYFETDDAKCILVDGEVYCLYPHPDMIEDVEVIYGYTEGDLIKITCDIEIQGEYKIGKVWSSILIEEGTPDNIMKNILLK